jgi:hypothetical protein
MVASGPARGYFLDYIWGWSWCKGARAGYVLSLALPLGYNGAL